jgi:uncharacterized protein
MIAHDSASMTRNPILLLALLALLAGCQATPGPRAEAPSEMDAQTLYMAGDFAGAARAYLELARDNRGERARYQLRAAEAWREEGDTTAMQGLIGDIDRRRLPAEDLLRLDLLEAELALGRGDATAALALLVQEDLPEAQAPRFLELRARARALSGDPIAAIADRAHLDALLEDGPDKQANAAEIRALVAGIPEQDLANRLRATDRSDPIYAWLLAGARTRTTATGESGGFARDIASSRPIESDRPAVALDAIERTPVTRAALLLPSRGPLAPAAAALREGVFAAYYADPGPRPLLTVYDAGQSVEETLAAYQQAVTDGAERILGPINREAVTALFQSDLPRVPTLALNYADAPALPPPGSLQFALLPEEEAAAAADRLSRRGLKRVLVLVPGDDVGQRAAAAFGERLRALGGTVVGEASYDAAATDQSAVIRRLAGIEQSEERARFLRGLLGMDLKTEPTPRADVDALFLFARNAQARVLLPQLKSFGATRFPIVSTSAINGGVQSAADVDLDGVEFCDATWLLAEVSSPGVPGRSELVALKNATGPAARLFAFGIDAWRLLPHLEWLEANPGRSVIGATGHLGADSNGRIRREPGWARYTGASPRPVD